MVSDQNQNSGFGPTLDKIRKNHFNDKSKSYTCYFHKLGPFSSKLVLIFLTISEWHYKFWITVEGPEIEDTVENEELEKESNEEKVSIEENESNKEEEIETLQGISFLIRYFFEKILIMLLVTMFVFTIANMQVVTKFAILTQCLPINQNSFNYYVAW